jgi:predicted solute-binding protein
MLAAARDEGIARLEEIALQAAPGLGISEADCLSYLRDHLEFRFGQRQRQGLERFFALAGRHGLAPADAKLNFYSPAA